jgi:HPt (histidine-containing phosphotransfer) domain-containing protein
MAEDLQGDRLRILIAALERRLEKQSSDLEKANERLKDEIEKRKRTEALLRECREIFYSFMRHQPAPAFIKNLEGKYVYLNEAYKKILKIVPAEHIGKTDEDIWPPDVAKQLKVNDSRVMFEGKALNTVETLKFGQKTQQFLIVRFPIFKNGKPFFLGGILVELTVNKEEKNHEPNRKNDVATANRDAEETAIPENRIPDSTPGLDIQSGIRRVGGSRKLYAELLKSFCDEKKNFVQEFQNHIKKKDIEAALISAHALKGSSAMISATELSQAAKTLEAACKDKEDEARIMESLKPVAEALCRLLALCENIPGGDHPLSGKPSEPAPPHTGDSAILSRLFKRLEKSFQELDPSESEICIRDIRNCFDAYHPGTEIENLFKDMAKQAGNYNFEEAGEILGRISRKIRFLPY